MLVKLHIFGGGGGEKNRIWELRIRDGILDSCFKIHKFCSHLNTKDSLMLGKKKSLFEFKYNNNMLAFQIYKDQHWPFVSKLMKRISSHPKKLTSPFNIP